MKQTIPALLLSVALMAHQAFAAPWPVPASPAVPEADGYVVIPDAAVPPAKTHVYRAIFDATRAADKPTGLLPALNMLGSELNALRVAGVPDANAKFAVVFHGAALQGIQNDKTYRAAFGTANPNLSVLKGLKAAGVDLLVCGQNLAFDHIDPKTLSPDVTVASDAYIVLMTYHDDGYVVLSF